MFNIIIILMALIALIACGMAIFLLIAPSKGKDMAGDVYAPDREMAKTH